MRLLLDTHIILWWATGDRRLTKSIASVISSPDSDVAVSAASIWEIAIKRSLGRIDVDLEQLIESIEADGFVELPIRFEHAARVEDLPRNHDDPFDRLLVAQAIIEGRRLVTRDAAVIAYEGVAGFNPLSG